MKHCIKLSVMLFMAGFLMVASQVHAQRQMEYLDRGLVAVKMSNGVFLSWRILGTEFTNTSYNVYRNGTNIATISSFNASNYTDASGTSTSSYYIKPVVGGIEGAASTTITPWAQFYKTVALNIPSGGNTPDGGAYTYHPNDCSVGDLDGDGEYEIIVKWLPSNAQDNSTDGYTGNVYLDAYKIDGTHLWRIDLGINIRAGAHYNPFMVYDLNGDGKAEVAFKGAPGTKGNNGTILGGTPVTDYRNSSGRILDGPEYLCIASGTSGNIVKYISYNPPRGIVSDWGDDYGNRCDRFLACVAYLNGETPSLVMCRGYYTRTVLVAYDYSDNTLTQRWKFDSDDSGNSGYAGQGCHSLCVGDVDNDGKDEIVYGSCTIDHDGTGKYTTGLGHGDALHLGNFDPNRSGLEVWEAHENTSKNGNIGATFRDAETGAIIWKYDATYDVGRGLIADIDGTNAGAECWALGAPVYTCTGNTLTTTELTRNTFAIWWDGDDYRELLSGNTLDKYNSGGSGYSRLVTLYNYESVTYNGSKMAPCLSADILGDWREEVMLRSSDNSQLVIFTTTTATSRRMYSLMHDPQYRMSIAWQNSGTNQTPNVGFFLGTGMSTPPTPDIYLLDENGCVASTINPYIKVNNGSWQNTSTVTVAAGDKVLIGPQPKDDGNWSWSGAGTTGTSREQTIYPTSSSVATATYTNSCGAVSSLNFTIAVAGNKTPPTAIVQNNNAMFKAYPNPVTDGLLSIEIPQNINTDLDINIYNIQGKLIYNKAISNTSSIDIELDQFIPGIYLIHVYGNAMNKTMRIEVQ